MDEDKELLDLGAEHHDDELAGMGAVTPEQHSEYIKAPEISAPTSALRGAEQGLTLGFADELGAGLGAGLEKTLGPDQGQNLSDLYQEYLKFNRDRYKQAEEANPISSTVGAIAGGALLPLGAVGKLGGVPAKLPKLAKTMLEGARVGAVAGGIAGVGGSEAPLLSKDTAEAGMSGAEHGMELGAGIPAVMPVAKGAAEGTYQLGENIGSRVFGPVKQAFKFGLAGDKTVGEAGAAKAGEEISGFAKSVAPGLQNELNRLGALKTKILKQADERGVRIDESLINQKIDDALNTEPKSKLPAVRRELEDLQELLRSYKEGKLVRKEVQTEMPSGKEKVRHIEELKKAEQEAIESGVHPGDIDTTYEPVDVPGKVAAVVRQKLYDADGNENGYKKLASRLVDEESIPNYKTSTEEVRQDPSDLTRLPEAEQLRKDLAEKSKFGDQSFKSPEVLNMAGKLTQDVRDAARLAKPQLDTVDSAISNLKQSAESIGITDTKDINEQSIMNKIINLINANRQGGASGIKAREQIDQFINHLDPVNPRLATKLRSNMDRLSSKLSVIEQSNKELSFLAPLSTARTLATSGANLAGYGISKAAQGIKNFSSSTSPEWMQSTAQKLSQVGSKGAQDLSQILTKAASKDDRARNALMFGLMQNPGYRQLLTPHTEDEVK